VNKADAAVAAGTATNVLVDVVEALETVAALE